MRPGFLRSSVAAVLVLSAPAAGAAPKMFSVQGMLGLTGEVEDDKRKFKGGASADGDDEDLESQIGVAVTYEVPLQEAIRLGGRVAFLTGEGDDTDGTYNTFDLGGWARYVFKAPVVDPYAAAGIGLTYATLEGDDNGVDFEGSGIGWHLTFGGGVTWAATDGIDLIGGIFYERQSLPEAEGEVDNGTKVDVTFEDVVFSRVTLMAGMMF